MRTLCFIAAFLILTGCNQNTRIVAEPAPEGAYPMTTEGFVFKEIPVYDAGPGGKRLYAVYVPRSYDPSKPTPAIVFLHGRGESGTDGQKQIAVGLGSALQLHSDQWPFIVIFPQKPDFESQWVDHKQMVLDILAKTQTEYNIDQNRVYLTGLSQGGAGTWALGSLYPDKWAALVPVCGYYRNMGDQFLPPAIAIKVKDLPIWAFHGLKDNVVPPEQTTAVVDAIQQVQIGQQNLVPIKITLLPDADHNAWDPAYRNYNLGQWFLQYVRRPEAGASAQSQGPRPELEPVPAPSPAQPDAMK
ncbi:MAG: hypothetical protein JSS51_02945 [Planctomycetes bacterium]|nr:hypothetical protein [Planctomycetota bacterium]